MTDYTNTSGVTLTGICVVTIGDHGRMIIESGLTSEQAQGYAKRIEARGRKYNVIKAEDLAAIMAEELCLGADL